MLFGIQIRRLEVGVELSGKVIAWHTCVTLFVI